MLNDNKIKTTFSFRSYTGIGIYKYKIIIFITYINVLQ